MSFNTENRNAIRDLNKDFKISYLEDTLKQWLREELQDFLTKMREQEALKNPLMTIPDLAKRFQVTKATVHNWINRGLITGNKVGKNRYFTEEVVRTALIKHGFTKQWDEQQ